jgi:hypothetical protein
MSDALGNPPSFGGNPGEPVPEVDSEDLKTVWQQERDFQARHPGQNVATGLELVKAICKPGANVQAVGYRSMMMWVLDRFAQEQLAPWVKDEQFLDAVFRTMATIPMEWVAQTPREGFPFDIEEFFHRLTEGGVQNG